MKIRYSELFTSFQGEAEYTGMPSVWLRFFGCNLQCDGFGQKDPTNPKTYDLPYQKINLDDIKTMGELPVLTKGCDSGYSWSSRFKHLAYTSNEKEIAKMIMDKAKDELGMDQGSFYHASTHQPIQICFTGGEPMLYQKAMVAIIKELSDNCGYNSIPQITIETNGTKSLDYNSFDSLRRYVDHIHFAISPKLFSVSGERDAVDIDNIAEYSAYADSTAVKYVINGTPESWDELRSLNHISRNRMCNASFWVMPVGASLESQRDGAVADIAREAMKRGYKVAARVHCYVFGNKMAT